jgi:hypothetical protein
MGRTRFIAFIALPVFIAVPASAQVGHAPERSPYRDIRHGTFLVALGGQVLGSGGEAGVAPHDGTSVGLRMTFLANRPLQVNLGATYGNLERLIQDPTQPVETRTTGPVSQRVLWVDAGLQFNLTGNKSWRGIAPFTGAAGGLSFIEDTPEDQTGFRMGTRFYFAPLVGTRLFLGERLYLQLEARALFWSVKYPTSFRTPPSPELPPVVTGSSSEWTLTPWLQAGIGWAFSWPF